MRTTENMYLSRRDLLQAGAASATVPALQAAFAKHDSGQCGCCTPGQTCSAAAVLDDIKAGVPSHVSADLNAQALRSVAELQERMSGNLCRGGAYSNIIGAMSTGVGELAMFGISAAVANAV